MANIAEGYGLKSNSEFANFLHIARGPAHEVQSHLRTAFGLGYIAKEEFESINNLLAEVSRLPLGLAKNLRRTKRNGLRNFRNSDNLCEFLKR